MNRMVTIKEALQAHAMELAAEVWPKGSAPATSADLAPWHIVHIVGKSDQHAIDFLKDRSIGLYYPHVREMRPVPKRKLSRQQRADGITLMRPCELPLFPRYLFVRLDKSRPGWREVFVYAGIGGMVCAGGSAVEVPDAMITNIRSQEVDGAIPGLTIARVVFKAGEALRIKEGAFAGFTGIVERDLDIPVQGIDSRTRLRVLVGMLGGHTPVALHVSQVERGEPP